MKIHLPNPYKSILPFNFELPDLTIITGVNGAGKTQLLTGIRDKSIIIYSDGGMHINSMVYTDNSNLVPYDSQAATKQSLSQPVEQFWSQYNSHKTQSKSNHDNIRQYFDIKHMRMLDFILERSKNDIDNLTLEDFHAHYPIEDGLKHNTVFHQNFANVFKRYNDRVLDNDFKAFRKLSRGANVDFFTEDEFIALYGHKPWDLANKIIEEAKLDYEVNSPDGSDKDIPFEIRLKNKLTGAEVKFVDLSSGEKVIMSLTLALYNGQANIEFPKVLLMDEPDAYLHPSMSKQFLDVIENVFVKEKGVKVIMTTHSPSTVALAKEECLFVMHKEGIRIEKVSKDKALKVLTTGVPSFSVNYENRRQVFVESDYDVKYYERIYQILSNHLNPEISLSFISSGDLRTDKNGIKVSNCDQVVKATEVLRNAGNKFVWGIIDFDGKNKSNDYVRVLGEGARYSIETYLLDPLLIGGVLLRRKFLTSEEIGLTINESYLNFKMFTTEQLGTVISFILKSIEPFIKSTDTFKSKVKLLRGDVVEIPNWFLNYQGHDLEAIIIKAFPKLNDIKKNKEEALKIEIIDMVIEDFPEYLSPDLLEIMLYIQNT